MCQELNATPLPSVLLFNFCVCCPLVTHHYFSVVLSPLLVANVPNALFQFLCYGGGKLRFMLSLKLERFDSEYYLLCFFTHAMHIYLVVLQSKPNMKHIE
jgi:hypothetical protein